MALFNAPLSSGINKTCYAIMLQMSRYARGSEVFRYSKHNKMIGLPIPNPSIFK
ncbi:hypothetical protein VS_II0665 [Vibrio atlanticus]|uniref:Uncharacterized protein n=1 Tax=Vibrio atlanticus (strain LGP32) TaxID=575788 RepID=B7VRR7_VIBA3|nr:hypothetical protein VS_II0665 [Vibrio atlanticus]